MAPLGNQPGRKWLWAPRLAALCVLLAVAGLVVGTARAEDAAIYLSPRGDDRWSGHLPDPSPDGRDGPLASFEAARDAARDGPGRIVVRGGAYHLRAEVAFDARDSGLTIESAGGEVPVIYGGPEVTGWTEDGARWSAPVDAEGMGALFLDGQAQPEARYPDLPPGAGPRDGWLFARPPQAGEEWLGNLQFSVRPGDLPPPGDPSGMVAHVVGGFLPGTQWGSDTLPVLQIDRAQAVIHTAGTGYFFTGTGSRYFLAGVEAFLDAPGEWWFDAGARRLDYIAAQGRPPTAAHLTAGVLPTFFRFTDARGVTVSGLTFTDGAPDGSGKYGTDSRGFGAIRLERAPGARITGNRFRNVGVAIHVSESPEATITGNDIAHVAGNAIYIGTAWDSFGRSDGAVVTDNRIRDVGEVYFESAGITFQASDHLRIERNTIEGAAQFGIAGGSIWGGQDACHDIIIAHNIIRDANRLTADGGAIKLMGMQSTPLDASIRFNVITGTDALMARPDGSFWPPRTEDADVWPSPISWAIYLDGRASGVTVEGNWLDGNVTGIGINGGWSNIVRGNAIRNGTGYAFRVDDGTGRDWRPDWAQANRIEDNFARIDRPDGRAFVLNAPGHGDGYVVFSGNRLVRSPPAGMRKARSTRDMN